MVFPSGVSLTLLVTLELGDVSIINFGDDLDGLIASIAPRTGYQIKEHWLQLFGLCLNYK